MSAETFSEVKYCKGVDKMKISIQSHAVTQRFDMDTAYRMIKDAGFEAIDWSLYIQWESGKTYDCWDRAAINSGKNFDQKCIYDEDMDKIIAHYQPEIDTIKKYGLTITQAHSSFFNYSSITLPFVEHAVETHKKVLKLCAYAGCPRLVIHGFSRQAAETVLDDNDIHAANMKMFTELIPTALETGVMILLENLFVTDGSNNRKYAATCSDPYDAIAYIDTLNEIAGSECFGLCFDTGHLNLANLRITEYAEMLGQRIKALHIHDNNEITDLHLAPYTGTISWKEFYSSLKKIGYTGDLNFETHKQVTSKRCEDAMVAPWLKYTYECGDFFRRKINENN